MNVLHLLASGDVGGIEVLCKDYAAYSTHNNYFAFLFQGGNIADEMKKAGRKIFEVTASKYCILKRIRMIISICKNKNIDVIIVHHTSPKVYFCTLCVKALLRKQRIIIYAHNNAADMIPSESKIRMFLRKAIIQHTFNIADRIIAISKSVEQSLHACFRICDKKISVIYNGVDVTRFTPAERQHNDQTELIYVGRLIPEKGVQNTLKTLSLLPKDINYRFRIVGDGVYRKELELLTGELGLQNRVSFLGIRRDIPELLQSSDIFIHMPDWEEGFGITIIEAMAAGVIPFCNSSGAIPEIIRNNICGIIADTTNLHSAAESLKALMFSIHSEHTTKFQYNAINQAHIFSIETFTRKLDCLIRNI